MDAIRRMDVMNPAINPDANKFKLAYNRDLTNYFFIDTKQKLDDGFHNVCTIRGFTGTGKSYIELYIMMYFWLVTGVGFVPKECFGLNVGKMIGRVWDFDNYGKESDKDRLLDIFKEGRINFGFNRAHLKKSVNVAKREDRYIKSTFGLDERPKGERVGHGAKRKKWELLDIQKLMRSLGMSFIRVDTEMEENENPHFLLEAQRDFDLERNLARSLIYQVNFDIPSGFIITRKPPDKLIEIYEFLKRVNQEKHLEGDTSDDDDMENVAKRMVNTPHWGGAKSKEEKIWLIKKATRKKWTMGEFNMIIARARMLGRMRKS